MTTINQLEKGAVYTCDFETSAEKDLYTFTGKTLNEALAITAIFKNSSGRSVRFSFRMVREGIYENVWLSKKS